MRLNVEITREDYADFAKFHFMKTGFKKTVLFYLVALIIMQLFLNKDGFHLFTTLFSTIIYTIICYFLISNRLNRTRKIPQDGGSFLGETEFTFSEDGISHKRQNSEGKVDWDIVKSFEEGKNAFYLYLDSIVAFVITKRSFANEQEIIDFKNLVERNIDKQTTTT